MKANLFKPELKAVFANFKRPSDIQAFLNTTPYNVENCYKSPLRVVREMSAHCFDGAVFAAAALSYLGYEPLIVDLVAENDDDHVIALFKHNGLYGSVAKSNTTVLRSRDPIYRNLRELIMSYFDFYFNLDGEKSLRSYSEPLNLSVFDNKNWHNTSEDLGFIVDKLEKIKHHELFGKESLVVLSRADEELYNAAFLGSNPDGLYMPGKK